MQPHPTEFWQIIESDALTGHTLLPPSTGINWLLTGDALAPYHPLLFLSHGGVAWKPLEPFLYPSLAVEAITTDIQLRLAKLIPHDVAGKMMGLNGILQSWQEEIPPPETAMEDLQAIHESLSAIHHLTQFLAWYAHDDPAERQILPSAEWKTACETQLPRLSKPPSLFSCTLQPLLCPHPITPHAAIWWILAHTNLLIHLKEPSEKVNMHIGTNHADSNGMLFTLQCPTLSRLLSHTLKERAIPRPLAHWLTLLASFRATVLVPEEQADTIEIRIPTDAEPPQPGTIRTIELPDDCKQPEHLAAHILSRLPARLHLSCHGLPATNHFLLKTLDSITPYPTPLP